MHVLESIKLLLDFPLFVVVVGVDARWLTRSLQIYFSDLLQRAADLSNQAGHELTSQDYLEKVFQYCFVLTRISGIGYEKLVRSMLGPLNVPEPHPRVSPTVDRIVADTQNEKKAAHEPGPRQLIVSEPEVDFAASLSTLFETPREAKRLINVYQLIRASLSSRRIERLEGVTSEYQAVLVLLAVATGRHRDLSQEMFKLLIIANPQMPWQQFCKDLMPDSGSDTPCNAFSANLTSQQAARWSLVASDLQTTSSHAPSLLVSELQDWIPTVAKFSFYPWRSFESPLP